MSLVIGNPHKTQIYLNQKYLNVPIQKLPENLTAPERIGDIWARMAAIYQSNNPEARKDLIPLLAKLGVSETDEDAHKTLIPLVGKVLNRDVEISQAEGNDRSGIYFIEKDAVFKVGPRACSETFARRFGEKFKLLNVIPGMYCTIVNPIFPKEEMPVGLYNGNEVVYQHQNGQGKTLTGIFEPFMPSKAFVKEGEKMTHKQFLHTALLAILLGAEDIKEDGITGDLIFDIENVMRPQPKPKGKAGYSDAVPTMHLPFLDCDFGYQKIPKEILKDLLAKIKAVRLPVLHEQLSNERIMYPDLIAEAQEAIEISDEDIADEESINDLYPKFKDQGNCEAFVRPTFSENGRAINIDPEDEESFSLFNESQMLGCMSRINLLREFIKECILHDLEPTAIELVKAADPLYRAHYENFANTPKNKRQHASPVQFVGFAKTSSWGGKLGKDVSEEVELSYSRSSSPIDENSSPRRAPSASFSSTEELALFLKSTPRSDSGSNQNNPFSKRGERDEEHKS